jgi:dipeptidyl aminopeptidase/acylaminoacyl peptidase
LHAAILDIEDCSMSISICGLVMITCLLVAQFPSASSYGLPVREQDTSTLGPDEGITPALQNRIPERGRRRLSKQTADLIPRLLKRTDDAKGIAISPDGKLLATGHTQYCARGEAKLWELETGRELATLTARSGMVKAVAFSPDGKTLAANADSDTWDKPPDVRLWDVATRKVRHTLAGHTKRLAAVAFSPDGRGLSPRRGKTAG